MSGLIAGPFVVLACFAVICGAAVVRRGQTASSSANRWLVASGLLASLTVVSLALAAFAETEQINDPLVGLLGLLTPALVAWAAMGASGRRGLDRGLAVLLGGCAIFFAVSVAGYPGPAAFRTSAFDQAWSLLALGISVIGALAVTLRRPSMWALFAVGLVLMATGLAAHVASAPPPSGALATMIGGAAAAPWIAIGAVAVLMRESPPGPVGPATTQANPSREARRWLRLAEADGAPEFASALTEAIGTLMRAEYCLLLTVPSSVSGLSIGAGYDLIRQSPIAGAALDIRKCPVIVQSIEAGRSVHLPAGTHSPDVPAVLSALGSTGNAPGLLVSLPAAGSSVAGLLLLSPHSQRNWDDESRLVLEGLAPSFGERLHRLMTRPAREEEVVSLRAEVDLARRQLAALEETRPSSAEATRPEWVGVADLQGQLDEAVRTIEMLEADIERLQRAISQPEPPRAEEDRLRAELALALASLAEARDESIPAPRETSRKPNGYSRAVEDARQPLTAIAGYTDLLLGESVGLLGTNQRKFLERIRTAVQRMEHSLAVLASRVPETAQEPAANASDLGAVIEQALEVIHEDLQSRGLAVRLDLPPQAIPVPADPKTLQAIISDLLANAAAATPTGREIHVSLHSDPDAGVAILAVTDRGRGVAADDLHRVFTATPWRDSVRGLGLDGSRLARVKSLTESIDGRAWVEREPNGGTTFFILLPSPSPT